MSEDRLDEALEAMQKAAELDPTALDNDLNVGAVYILRNEVGQASRHFNRYLTQNRSSANAYYLGIMLNSSEPADRELAQKIRVIFPNQEDRGAHFNVSAIGVTRFAKNKDAAQRYMEFLLSEEVQQRFAVANYEYPISLDFSATPTLESWGEFEVDTDSFPGIGDHLDDAISIFDRVGWQ